MLKSVKKLEIGCFRDQWAQSGCPPPLLAYQPCQAPLCCNLSSRWLYEPVLTCPCRLLLQISVSWVKKWGLMASFTPGGGTSSPDSPLPSVVGSNSTGILGTRRRAQIFLIALVTRLRGSIASAEQKHRPHPLCVHFALSKTRLCRLVAATFP